jgi:SAM-dependent methyltransferase
LSLIWELGKESEVTMSADRDIPSEIDVERPNAARIYDYFLGGYHNFEVDRVMAEKLRELLPSAPLYMQANRAFLRRVIGYLTDQGIDQFLDIGSGLPTVGNVHEVAQAINPAAQVVYVDIDPVAVHQSKEILKGNANATAIQGDARHPEAILEHPEVRRILDFDRPVAVLLVSILLFMTEDEETIRTVRVLRDALAPGSYIAISHPTDDDLPQDEVEEGKRLYAASGNPVTMSSFDQIKSYFDGLELVEPGIVYVSRWRPEGPDFLFDEAESSGYYVGVGRNP